MARKNDGVPITTVYEICFDERITRQALVSPQTAYIVILFPSRTRQTTIQVQPGRQGASSSKWQTAGVGHHGSKSWCEAVSIDEQLTLDAHSGVTNGKTHNVGYKLCILIFDVVRAARLRAEMFNLCDDSRLIEIIGPWQPQCDKKNYRTCFAVSAFSVAGRKAWNSIPPTSGINCHNMLCRHLKT